MSKSHSRRSILAGIATAPALAAPALASQGDTRLRILWAQYLEHFAALRTAKLEMDPARAAFDAEETPCPPDVLPGAHWRAMRPLWEKHGLDRLYDTWSAASDRVDATVQAMREEEAEGLFGLAVKLAALPDGEGGSRDPAPDHEDAIAAALGDIDRLIGSTFVSSFSVLHMDDDGEDEAVS